MGHTKFNGYLSWVLRKNKINKNREVDFFREKRGRKYFSPQDQRVRERFLLKKRWGWLSSLKNYKKKSESQPFWSSESGVFIGVWYIFYYIRNPHFLVEPRVAIFLLWSYSFFLESRLNVAKFSTMLGSNVRKISTIRQNRWNFLRTSDLRLKGC